LNWVKFDSAGFDEAVLLSPEILLIVGLVANSIITNNFEQVNVMLTTL
jgi:hypothetical protein